jgi:hypothetical protein
MLGAFKFIDLDPMCLGLFPAMDIFTEFLFQNPYISFS